MNGLDQNLLDWCGLQNLGDVELDKIWSTTSDMEILENCESAEIESAEGPEVPLFTDTWIEVYSQDVEKLRLEVKGQIIDLLSCS